jgi:glycosyltransferase involved in cell wall biosynthesis
VPPSHLETPRCCTSCDSVTLTIRKLEHEILAAGHNVCILTTLSGDLNHTHMDGTHPNRQVIFMDNAIPIPFLTDPEKPELSYSIGFSLSPAVKQQIDEYEPSIIHLCVTDCTSLHIIQYARQKEIPIMGTYHSNIPEYMEHYPGLSWLKYILGAFFRHQYNYYQALYVPTPYIEQHLIEEYRMDRVTSLNIWGRGVDVDKFNPAFRSEAYRQHLGVDEHTPIILWVGRLVPEKRPDIFMNVVRRLHQRGNIQFHALVVGAGSGEEDKIRALPNTTFAGWMSGDQLSMVYASADIFLFPSAVETFGNVTLEAAASGLPVIVEAGCSGHLVHHDENGFAVAADDEDAFFEATLTLVEDRQMREDFGMHSRDLALSLEKSSVVRQMLENYTHVTDQFYTEYSGRHAHRDAVYTQDDSFLLGKYPRPLILVIFETLFVFLFNMIWKLSSAMLWFARSIGRTQSSKKIVKETAVAARIPAPHRKAEKHSDAGTPKVADQPSQSVIELNDVEIGSKSRCLQEHLLVADDLTSATSNSSSQNAKSPAAVTDLHWSHRMVIFFIHSVQFQCRLEARVREYFSTSSRSSGGPFVGAAKRKNSNMTAPQHDLGDTSFDILRGRFDLVEDANDDVVDESSGSPISVASLALPEGRMVSRRSQTMIPPSVAALQ